MKRWNYDQMFEKSMILFKKIYKRKYLSHHNHEIHFMFREINDWLTKSIQSLIDGNYTPRFLKRTYFEDGCVDQLHPVDRIIQNILLQQIKPTFSHVISPNCYHLLSGPHGVKLATQRIRQILENEQPKFLIRADIKSFYSSILHNKLLQDIKKTYNDPKLINMLEQIIKNPIETPRGYCNPVTGIALRGPLSQFFSALYLQALDETFSHMQVQYLRYQDDLLILCKTKRQLKRCQRKMMQVLQERGLSLSRKKTRIGSIEDGFHFLGIFYPMTQTLDNIDKVHSEDNNREIHQQNVQMSIVPHERTLRKAREQMKIMVATGNSTRQIRRYLHLWTLWWVKTAEIWQYSELLSCFIQSWYVENEAKKCAEALLLSFKIKHSACRLVPLIRDNGIV